jgi:hypothetical protein
MKNRMRRSMALVAASATAVSTILGALLVTAPVEAAEQARAGPSACRGMEQLTVPGAERLEAACLNDLTTTGTTVTGHTDPSGSFGFGGLSVPGTVNASGVPVSSSTATSRTPPPSTRRMAGTTTPSS